MTLSAFMQAHRAFVAEGQPVGDTFLKWTGANLSDFHTKALKDGYGCFRNVMSKITDINVEINMDNRSVVLHGTGISSPTAQEGELRAGPFLKGHWLAIEKALPPIPGVRIWRYEWKDHGFRFGYMLDEAKSLKHDPKVMVLYTCLRNIAHAVSDHCDYVAAMEFKGDRIVHYADIHQMLRGIG